MATSNWSGPIDSENGFSVNGTTVINSSGAIIGDIQATAGSIGTAELADSAITLDKIDDSTMPFVCIGGVLHTWDGGAATTDTATITGVLATDLIVGNFTTTNTNGVTIEQIARTGTDTVTITTSGNAADGDVIAIAAFRTTA